MERKDLAKYTVPIKEQKRKLKEADDSLPQDIRDNYPIESLREITKKYNHKWVAFLTTDIYKGFPIAGRVVGTADDSSGLDEIRSSFSKQLKRSPTVINTDWLEGHPAVRVKSA